VEAARGVVKVLFGLRRLQQTANRAIFRFCKKMKSRRSENNKQEILSKFLEVWVGDVGEQQVLFARLSRLGGRREVHFIYVESERMATMKRNILTTLAAMAMLTGAGTAAQGAVLSFQAGVSPEAGYTADAVTIRNDGTNASTNQNGSVQIIVGVNNTNSLLRGLFEFDLTAIETAAAGNPYTIDSVTLVLRQGDITNAAASSITYDLHLLGANSDFNETAVTWNDAPTVAGGSVGTLLSSTSYVPNSGTAFRTFGTTTAFESAVADILANDVSNSIRLIAKANNEAATTQTFSRFDSDEVTTAANRPQLNVTYTVVPEPGSAMLAISVGALLLRRRR